MDLNLDPDLSSSSELPVYNHSPIKSAIIPTAQSNQSMGGGAHFPPEHGAAVDQMTREQERPLIDLEDGSGLGSQAKQAQQGNTGSRLPYQREDTPHLPREQVTAYSPPGAASPSTSAKASMPMTPSVLQGKKVQINRIMAPPPTPISSTSITSLTNASTVPSLPPRAKGSSHTSYRPPAGIPSQIAAPSNTSQSPSSPHVRNSSDTPSSSAAVTVQEVYRPPELVAFEPGYMPEIAIQAAPPDMAPSFIGPVPPEENLESTYANADWWAAMEDGDFAPKGSGISTHRLVDIDVHPHPAYFISHDISSEEIFSNPRAAHSALPGIDVDRALCKQDYGRRHAVRYYFCPTCVKWFRVFAGELAPDTVASLIGGGNDTIKSASRPNRWAGSPEAGKDWNKERARLDSVNDGHSTGGHYPNDVELHHFHSFKAIGEWDHPENLQLISSQSEDYSEQHAKEEFYQRSFEDRNMLLCCRCNLSVVYEDACLPGVLSKESVAELLDTSDRIYGDKLGKESVVMFLRLCSLLLQRLVLESDSGETGFSNSEGIKAEEATVLRNTEQGRQVLVELGFLPEEVADPWNPKFRFDEDYDQRNSPVHAWLIRSLIELELAIGSLEGQSRKGGRSLTRSPILNGHIVSLRKVLMTTAGYETKTAFDHQHMSLEPNKSGASDAQVNTALQNLGCSPEETVRSMCRQMEKQMQCDPCTGPMCKDALLALSDPKAKEFLEDQEKDIISSFMRRRAKDTPGKEDDLMAINTLTLDSPDVADDAILLKKTVCEQLSTLGGIQDLSDEDKLRQANCLLDALKVIARYRNNPQIYHMWRLLEQQWNGLDPSYNFLKSRDNPKPDSLDEDSWIAVYTVQSMDNNKPPTSDYFIDWREPYRVIALARGFKKLLAVTGFEEPDSAIEQDPKPPGLYNIGNTCYLNSLLQYLYSVRPLKEAVLQMAGQTQSAAAGSTDELRIGGRLVSSKEVQRSVNFSKRLAVLFKAMDDSDSDAVRPERDLAYLALVGASADTQIEEVMETGNAGLQSMATSEDSTASSSNFTLVDAVSPPSNDLMTNEPPSMNASPSNTTESSVLGKRSERDEQEDEASAPESTVTDAEQQMRSPSASRSIKPLPSRSSSRPTPEIGSPLADVTEDAEQPVAAMEEDVTEQTKGLNQMDIDRQEPPSKGAAVPPPLPPRPTPQVSMSGPMMFGQQNDVSETLDNCLFQLETAFASFGTESEDKAEEGSLVRKLFFGLAKQQVYTKDEAGADLENPATDVLFNNILLNVAKEDSGDLYDKLHDIYYLRDNIELGGKAAEKAEMMEICPPILNMQLQRVLFDRKTARPFKSNAAIRYSKTIYMDRFMPSADPTKREISMALTKEITEKKTTLKSLRSVEPLPVEDNLVNLGAIMEATGLADMSDVSADLQAEAARIGGIAQDCVTGIVESRGQLEAIWDNDKMLEYELSSVFMHRGQAGYGHYWLYQRDLPANPDRWFQFNDETVRIAPEDEVFRFINGDTASAYLVVYVKKGHDFIETASSRKTRIKRQAEVEREAELAKEADLLMQEIGDVLPSAAGTAKIAETTPRSANLLTTGD